MHTFFQILGILNVLAGAFLLAPGAGLIALGALIILLTLAHESKAGNT